MKESQLAARQFGWLSTMEYVTTQQLIATNFLSILSTSVVFWPGQAGNCGETLRYEVGNAGVGAAATALPDSGLV